MTKIMLVEDDNNLREIYEARLSAEGFEIVTAQDGEAALAIAGKEKPDLIVSDVMMPKISGFEMLDILRNTEALRNVKVIMLTALSQAEDSQRADSLGADRYLVKSQVTLEDIVKAAHELLDDPATVAPTMPAEATEPEDDEPAAAAPTPAPEAAHPSETAPAMISAEPAVVEPVGEPATPVASEPSPAVSVTPEPPMTTTPVAPEPTPAVPVTSIPVTDISDNSTDTPATSVPEPTRIDVVEPPAEPTASTTAPVTPPISTTDTPSASSGSANPSTDDQTASDAQPQADPLQVVMPEPALEPVQPTVADSEQVVSQATPQAATDEEAAIHEQINSFINTQVTEELTGKAPVEHPESEPAIQPADALSSQPDVVSSELTQDPQQDISMIQPTQGSVEETAQTSPLPAQEVSESPQGALASAEVLPPSPPEGYASASAPMPAPSQQEEIREADFEPAVEDLSVNDAPVITSVDGASVPAQPDQTIPSPVTVTPAPEADQIVAAAPQTGDDLLASAINNLSSNVPDSAPSSDGMDKSTPEETKKVIEPLPSQTPDVNQMLSLEESRLAAQQAATIVTPPQPNVAAYTPSANIQPQAPSQPAPATEQIDPNSISL